MTNVDIKKLDAAPAAVVESTGYMTVISPKGAKGKGVPVFESTDKKMSVWLAQYDDKLTLKLTNWPIDEYMQMVEGKLEITDEKGVSHVYGPGDSFVMPKGFSGTWRQLTEIKKITVNYAR